MIIIVCHLIYLTYSQLGTPSQPAAARVNLITAIKLKVGTAAHIPGAPQSVLPTLLLPFVCLALHAVLCSGLCILPAHLWEAGPGTGAGQATAAITVQ